ncbi:MAG: isoprenylcysteine carboxylmethyltransferase family protein [Pseudohongiella sp.]|uniref:isoprenylcysteine carboxylmethyltransferase family protein n=1 Tax=Pseudohongiella sp. TaxID=1979412 RepID=UPI0034A01CB4
MTSLELKIPPLLLVLISAALMWQLQDFYPLPWLNSLPGLVVAVLLVVAGLAAVVAGGLAFRRAQTTVDPRYPEQTSQLVTGGIYRLTRNPMYLGMALALAGWAVYLADVTAFLMLALFIRYMGRYQIGPEERILLNKFGSEFEQYCAGVRRWI